ncbi:hypothetical protein [Verticiella alkaliphila]|uniref:hypothetical protein n=1 Tax=Verticiella alkaliphila TaxID=2779529 RepID=UPI00209AA366|nr:hypothetical protein [Verticiella sp. GG226]
MSFVITPVRCAVLMFVSGAALAQTTPAVQELQTIQVLGTAEQEVRESLGVSVITAEEIEKRRRRVTCPKCCVANRALTSPATAQAAIAATTARWTSAAWARRTR